MPAGGNGDAEEAVEFINGAVGLDAQVIFTDAAAIKKAGVAGIALTGVNLHGPDAFIYPQITQILENESVKICVICGS